MGRIEKGEGFEVRMLRYAQQHFESLRPYRWRLERMLAAARPKWGPEYKALQAALTTLDRAAELILDPDEFEAFRAPWIASDHA